MNNYYEYKEGDAERFASSIQAKHRMKHGQIEFLYCPYCYGGPNKDKSTFAISTRTGQFECKRSSCGVKGNMITLAKDFADKFELSAEVSMYYDIDNGHEKKKFRKFKDAHRITESKDAAIEYLESRCIPAEITRKYEVTTKPNQDNVLVFPFKDENGELQFIKYRNTTHQKGSGSKEWCERDCKPILFGMNHCEDFGTLVVTEGQIDSLSLAAVGIKNAVSVPTGKNGFTWRPHCWNWLNKFDEIVVFGDHENGEITLAKEFRSFFRKKVRVVRPEDYKGCKDANDILREYGKEALIDAVNKADVKLSNLIKQLSDVESKNLKDMESIYTGFPDINSEIGGGFHLGELIILTGKCGEGKSTFASMCIAYAIQQGYKTFCYSGELPDFQFKSWFDQQIIGKSELKSADAAVANNWYRDKLYIYDNTVIDDADPFDAIVEAIKNLNCKFIVIDNLMMAMENKPSEDLYRQQSEFVGKCAKLAKAFNVVVLLVAHPRKGTDNSNDSISGSGDITNKADIVLRYQRGYKYKGDDNKYHTDWSRSSLMITKNRTTGKLRDEFNSIPMIYKEDSRRVIQYGEKEPVFFEKLTEEFTEVSENEEIPFD